MVQTMRFGLTLVAAISAGFITACDRAAAQTETAGSMGSARYQVVDGTPQFARNIMLLDTRTGRTWQVCQMADSSTGWCVMRVEKAPAQANTAP